MNARLLSLMIVLAGCAEARYVRAPDPAALPADALAVVRSGGDPMASLRATFTARARLGETTEQVRGVLLVRRPDRFRMRLSSLLGITVLDYTLDGSDDRLWLAGQGVAPPGAEEGPLTPATVRWIFLRSDDRLNSGCREIAGEDSIVVECAGAQGTLLYRGWVRAGALLLERETVFEDGTPRLSVAYTDYRPIAGVRLPYSIEWTETAPPRRITIEIDRYEVNPDLPSDMFAG